ncbi:BRO-N domain-containing protein, partial [Komagataeibacter europaeus]
MNQNIIPFAFKGHEIRTVLVDGEPAFVGKDVCERLGYANPNKAMNDHCKGVTKRYPLQTPGGLQEVRVLFEPDVLRLIIKSKLPEAEEFERWVFEEVLPAIRKTGGYMHAALDETPEELALRAMSVLQETVKRQKAQLDEVLPKAAALDRISFAEGEFGQHEVAKMIQVKPGVFTKF